MTEVPFSITSLSSSLSTTPPDSAHIHSVVAMATAQSTELLTSMNNTSAEVDSTRKNPNSDHLKESDDVFEDLEADAQELRTITRHVAASVVADFADSSDYREKSNAASEGSATKEISYTFPRNQVKSLEINREINRNHMKSIKKSLEVDQKSDI